MLNKYDKENFIEKLERMNGMTLLINTRSIEKGNITKGIQTVNKLKLLYNDIKFCLFDECSEDSIELPLDKVEYLYIDVDNTFTDEDEDIHIIFNINNIRYDIISLGMLEVAESV